MVALSDLPLGVLVAFGLALGLVIGSFLNVVVYRLPRGESLVHPGSHCPACSQPVKPWDNIPLLSYLLLGGRCRHCRVAISLRYPALELLTGLLFAGLVWRFGASPMTPVWLAFAAALVAAAAIDFDHRIIPDALSLGGLAVAGVAVPLARAASGWPLGAAVVETGVGALLGGGLLWIVGFGHARYCAVLGRRFEHWPDEGEDFPRPASLDYWTWFPGLGFGDVKLLAMIGAVLGPWGAIETIIAAAFLGLVFGVGWAIATRHWNAPFGFAPAIAAGALLVALLPVEWLARWLGA